MARIVWLAVVVAIVAAGALASALPRPQPAPSVGRLPAELISEAEFDCVSASGLLRYGNLGVEAVLRGDRITGVVRRSEPSAAVGSTTASSPQRFFFHSTIRPDASIPQTDAVGRRLSACLEPLRFDPPASVRPGAAVLLRLREYHVTVYWPCLRAHGAHPGPVPPVSRYASASEVGRLVPFQRGYQASDPTALPAAAKCVFEPDALRAPAGAAG